MTVYLIAGPPCSGKTSYAKANMKTGSVLIDADLLAEALGSPSTHDHPPHIKALAAKARDFATKQANRTASDVWIVSASPTAEKNIPHDEVIVIDTPRQVCYQRAERRPRWTREAINKWFEARGKKDVTPKKTKARAW